MASTKIVVSGPHPIPGAGSGPIVAVANRVVVLEEGTVTAKGTHPNLAAENETYRSAVLA